MLICISFGLNTCSPIQHSSNNKFGIVIPEWWQSNNNGKIIVINMADKIKACLKNIQ